MGKRTIGTNVDMFAKRGDPMITEREREKSWKIFSFENPELDRFTKAKQAPKRKPEIIKRTLPQPPNPDIIAARLRANIRIRVRKAIREEEEAKRVKRIIKEEARQRREAAILDDIASEACDRLRNDRPGEPQLRDKVRRKTRQARKPAKDSGT